MPPLPVVTLIVGLVFGFLIGVLYCAWSNMFAMKKEQELLNPCTLTTVAPKQKEDES